MMDLPLVRRLIVLALGLVLVASGVFFWPLDSHNSYSQGKDGLAVIFGGILIVMTLTVRQIDRSR